MPLHEASCVDWEAKATIPLGFFCLSKICKVLKSRYIQSKTKQSRRKSKRQKTTCIIVELPPQLLRSCKMFDHPDEGETPVNKGKDPVLNLQKAKEQSGPSGETHRHSQQVFPGWPNLGPGEGSRFQLY